ncbi:GNAT family N-acyltransferase [Lentisphaerota bacterium WC36G]|nr:GNAT family N-acetyltransferase [Lentisphaerae bacterium WC36]
MSLVEVIKRVQTPSVLAEKDQFIIKLAESDEEVEKACRLRYEVFNLEQGKGLDYSETIGLDTDCFDDVCHHLIIVEKETNKFVGTYRMQFGMSAIEHYGFYSATEYELTGIEHIAPKAIEVGRSCVHPDYRSGAVVSLLWAGIAEVMRRSQMHYLFGCVSLEEVNSTLGWALYKYFCNKELLSSTINGKTKSEYILADASDNDVSQLASEESTMRKKMPPLLKGYLRLGAKICSEPALDNEFGTIDYLICLNIHDLPLRYRKHYMILN